MEGRFLEDFTFLGWVGEVQDLGGGGGGLRVNKVRNVLGPPPPPKKKPQETLSRSDGAHVVSPKSSQWEDFQMGSSGRRA